MNYIVLDLEWNQAVSPNLVRTSPVHLSGEIIEFGAVRLNDEFETQDEFRLFVKPFFYKKLHWSVSKLTKITKENLENADSFATATEKFFTWCGSNPVFITWGPDDIPMLRNNMQMYGMETTMLENAYDAQVIFDLQVAKRGRQHGLSDAMSMVNETELPAHDALHDAINTVAVCRHLDMKKGIAEYPKIFNLDNLPILFTDTFRYKSYDELKKNQSHMRMKCPACECEIVSDDWIISGSNRKISLATCENGHKYFLRYKLKKYSDETVSVLRLTYNLTDELKEYFDEKNAKYLEKMEKYHRRFTKGKKTTE